MTEFQIRQAVVGVMRSWMGATEGSDKHREILTVYNGHRPLARGYAMQLHDAWCAATVSAAWIRVGVSEVAVLEVSVPIMVQLAQQKGIWVENDAYVPAPGDAIVYDWDDDGAGDNRGSGDHVGIVERVSSGVITVIEGNMGSGHIVGRRSVPVNGRYIRGFICPTYSALADKADERTCDVTLPVLHRGSTGGHVRTCQVLLNRYNDAGLAEDGVFGPATESAVLAYQRDRGLAVDAWVGVETWAQLLC